MSATIEAFWKRWNRSQRFAAVFGIIVVLLLTMTNPTAEEYAVWIFGGQMGEPARGRLVVALQSFRVALVERRNYVLFSNYRYPRVDGYTIGVLGRFIDVSEESDESRDIHDVIREAEEKARQQRLVDELIEEWRRPEESQEQ